MWPHLEIRFAWNYFENRDEEKFAISILFHRAQTSTFDKGFRTHDRGLSNQNTQTLVTGTALKSVWEGKLLVSKHKDTKNAESKQIHFPIEDRKNC